MAERNPINRPGDFRDIPGFPGYKVSKFGEVWSCRCSRWMGRRGSVPGFGAPWHRLNTKPDVFGYPRVLLMPAAGGKQRLMTVHSLVLLAFVGPRPYGMQCCHTNGNPADNALGNLRYDTPKGNQTDRDRHGRTIRGERSARAKLTAADVRAIRRRYAAGDGDTYSLAADYGVAQGTVFFIVSRRTWKHVV